MLMSKNSNYTKRRARAFRDYLRMHFRKFVYIFADRSAAANVTVMLVSSRHFLAQYLFSIRKGGKKSYYCSHCDDFFSRGTRSRHLEIASESDNSASDVERDSEVHCLESYDSFEDHEECLSADLALSLSLVLSFLFTFNTMTFLFFSTG